MRQPLVAGNWKMNGSRQSNMALLEDLKAGIGAVRSAKVAVCPPYVYLAQAQEFLQGTPIAWGAQDVSNEPKGAFTGEMSAPCCWISAAPTRSWATRRGAHPGRERSVGGQEIQCGAQGRAYPDPMRG